MPPLSFTDPNLAFLFLVLGALGLSWEMHAPGLVLPGVLGFLLLCAAAYGLYQDAPTWYGLALLAFALVLLGVELKVYTHMVSGLIGAILLAWGAMVLLQGPRRISPAFAVAAAMALGCIAAFLGTLANRARKTKRLTGLETLVGEVGIARTDINLDGMIFVQGAYWKARSDSAIPAGKPVRIERVDQLVLHVKET
jgi:membrane-bound serine protease (ClpP class)